jgi:glyoxylase-like metal-dependent hydrolase (beta-lactamase superfamily II)
MLIPENYGPVKALHMGRKLLGIFSPLMSVRCYAVDGLLIDTGLLSKAKQVLKFARQQQIRQVVLTHHHEDHSGNACSFVEQDYPVLASQSTAELMQEGFDIHFYERVIWGSAPPTSLQILPDELQTEHYNFHVLPAPGHSFDQVVLYEADQGWLFSADAFIAERIKIFRADEDFAQTVSTLKSLLQLDFEQLFCAHRPVLKNGKKAMQRKLDYMLELEYKVNKLASQGYNLQRITQKTLGPEDAKMMFFTRGDVCKRNVVKSILFGPEERGSPSP